MHHKSCMSVRNVHMLPDRQLCSTAQSSKHYCNKHMHLSSHHLYVLFAIRQACPSSAQVDNVGHDVTVDVQAVLSSSAVTRHMLLFGWAALGVIAQPPLPVQLSQSYSCSCLLQGSCLSSLLCSIFLADLEARHLQELMPKASGHHYSRQGSQVAQLYPNSTALQHHAMQDSIQLLSGLEHASSSVPHLTDLAQAADSPGQDSVAAAPTSSKVPGDAFVCSPWPSSMFDAHGQR